MGPSCFWVTQTCGVYSWPFQGLSDHWVIKRSRMEEAGMQIRNITKCYTFTIRRLLFVTLWRVFHWETGCWFLMFFCYTVDSGMMPWLEKKKEQSFIFPKRSWRIYGAQRPTPPIPPPQRNKGIMLGGGNWNMSCFHSEPWGNDPNWRVYFWDGLKPPTSLANNPWIRPYFLWGVALWGFDTCRTAQQMWPDITKLPYFKQGNSGGKHIINQVARTTRWYTSGGTPPEI